MDEVWPNTGDDSRPDAGRLVPLTDAECAARLEEAEVGRIAWCTSRGPVVLPVNIRFQDGTVLIRTSGLSAMVAKVDAERVAIEVDHVDAERQEGWSVLARGVAAVRPAPRTPDPGAPNPWPRGGHSAEVRVQVDELTGRRLA